MTFLAPAWLLLAGLAGVIFFLHARRRRRVDFSSVHIWRLIEQSTTRRRSLQRPPVSLLLVLQLLALALIAIALAQPRIGGADAEGEHIAFVIDGSASMQTTDEDPTRFDAAKAYLTEAITDLGEGSGARFSVVVAEAQPFVAVARQTTAAGATPIVEDLRVTDGQADWVEAASVLANTMREGEPMRIVLLSDETEAATSAFAEAFPDADVQSVGYGDADAQNVELVATVSPMDLEDGEWRATGEVRFHGMAATGLDIAVRFSPQGDDRFLDFGTIEIAPPESEDGEPVGDADGDAVEGEAASPATIAFDVELEFPGPGSLILELPEDAAAYDNARYFTLGLEERRPQVLVLGSDNADLQRAIAAIDGVDLYQGTTLPEGDTAFDLVVVDDISIARQPRTNVLWLERGRIAGEQAPEPMPDAYVTGWNANHPLSANVEWGGIASPRAYAVPQMDGATIVASAAGGPLVQARTTPQGREIRVALAAAASEWVLEPSFPVFIANVVDWLGIGIGELRPGPCTVGQICQLEARFAAAEISTSDGDVVVPGASDAPWLIPGADERFVPERAGFYRVEGSAGAFTIAVNQAGGESDVSVGDVALSGPNLPSAPTELWRILLLAALIVLIAEAWIAGRGSERFLRPRALARGAPLATQRRWHLGLRIVACVLIALGVVSLPLPTQTPAESVVVVAATDVTFSGDTARQGVLDRVAAESDEDSAAGRIGLVTLGNQTQIGVDFAGETDADVLAADSPGPGANLEQAVRLAAAMLPADRPGRVVVAGDGNETAGNVALAVAPLADRGIPVDVRPTADIPAGEVLVERVTVPAQIYAGDSFTLNAILYAETSTDALVTLLRNGETASENSVVLSPGRNRVEAVFNTTDPGDDLFEVVIEAPGDIFTANNRDGVIASIEPTPSVLIVSPDEDWGIFFADALAVQGLQGEVVLPDRAPFFIDGWLEHDLVVLMNVPALDLTVGQQELLAEYVETHGRGLLILGGENAFGPGGYYQTALERISPLSARVPQDAPGTALMFVLDRSGSMQARVEDVNRLVIAKEATFSAVELLHEESQVGVTVFDSEAHVIVPMQEQKDEAAIRAALEPIEPGGGTALYPALEAAINELRAIDSEAKHMILMTDGLIEPADFPSLLEIAQEAGITVSTVAIGSGADVTRSEAIARLGGGAFHATQDFRALPSILSQEAMMLSGTPVKVGTTPVFWVDRDAPFLEGLPANLPDLQNYVATTARPTASLHLATIDEEGEQMPIMASWRYGNGRVLALATHGAGSGTQNWLELQQYPLFWGQIVRHFLPSTQGPGLHAVASRSGDLIEVTAEVVDADGAAVTDATVIMSRPDSDGEVAMEHIGAGTYQATVADAAVGTQSFVVTYGDVTTEVSSYVGYPARLNFARAEPAVLAALAAETGGQVFSGDPLAGATDTVWEFAPSWRPWALAGLIIFLLDLVVRYAPGLLAPWRGRASVGRPAGLAAPA